MKHVLSRLIHDQKLCITMVSAVDAENKRSAIGIAVCDEDDKWDDKLGFQIASGRAAKALAEGKSTFFRRPDVMVDFAMCGLNIRGVKRMPKAIFYDGGAPPVAIKVFAKQKRMLKLLGVPT